jgi:hypothetical protein
VAHRRNVIFTQGDVRVAMSYHSRARTWNRRTTVQRDSVKRCGIDGAIVAVLRLQGPSSHDWARRMSPLDLRRALFSGPLPFLISSNKHARFTYVNEQSQ